MRLEYRVGALLGSVVVVVAAWYFFGRESEPEMLVTTDPTTIEPLIPPGPRDDSSTPTEVAMSSKNGAPAGFGKPIAIGLVLKRGWAPQNGATILLAPPDAAVTIAPMPASTAMRGYVPTRPTWFRLCTPTAARAC